MSDAVSDAVDGAAGDRAAALTERVDALLPQTQCRRCGYDACRPYAAALAAGRADLNRCPPGGAATIVALAELLGRPLRPLADDVNAYRPRQRALIDEDNCIGCTKCIQACPLDAIVGAAKRMHTVIGADCSGCELCLPPCPVDCIELVADGPIWDAAAAAAARRRYRARERRLAAPRRPPPARGAEDDAMRHPERLSRDAKQTLVAAALARARAKKAARRGAAAPD